MSAFSFSARSLLVVRSDNKIKNKKTAESNFWNKKNEILTIETVGSPLRFVLMKSTSSVSRLVLLSPDLGYSISTIRLQYLKGLSYEMDLAFDDMNGQF